MLTPYFLPWNTAEGMEAYAELYAALPAKLILILALLYRPKGRPATAERQFWGFFAAAYLFWALVDLLDLAAPNEQFGSGRDTLEEVMYVGFYLMLAFALETRPDAAERSGALSLRALRNVGVVLFGFGLAFYIAFFAVQLDDGPLSRSFPSLFLYVILDLYVLARLLALRASCSDPNWRRVYGCMLIAAVSWVALDIAESLFYYGVLPWVPMGTLLDLAWHLPFVAVLVTARVREAPIAQQEISAKPAGAQLDDTWGGPLILVVVAIPVVHFAVNALGISDPATLAAREALVVFLVVVLSLIAIVYQRILEKDKHALEAENRLVTDQLELAQRMEAVGRLAGGIAHDLNNILQVIRAASDLLRQRLSADAQENSELDLIEGAIDRSSALTDQLITMSRRKRNDPKPLALNEVAGETGRMLQRLVGDDIELSFDLDSSLALIRVDRSEIEQVIMNLGVNARDAMPDGGVLEIRTLTDPDGFAVLVVRDSGTGIDEATRSHMFEPFFTTKSESRGTGLGLAIVYAIVARCGGRIEVDSAVSKGTTLSVYFPLLSGSERAPQEANLPMHDAVGGSESILLVEDEEAVRSSVGRLLKELGYRVVAVANGQQALQVLESQRRPFDLLLSDVVMPGLKGPQLAELVQKHHPGTAALLMSGFIGESSNDAGAEGYLLLRKPFTRRELAEGVRRVLDIPLMRPAEATKD